jgi:hypothetical protein
MTQVPSRAAHFTRIDHWCPSTSTSAGYRAAHQRAAPHIHGRVMQQPDTDEGPVLPRWVPDPRAAAAPGAAPALRRAMPDTKPARSAPTPGCGRKLELRFSRRLLSIDATWKISNKFSLKSWFSEDRKTCCLWQTFTHG